MTGPETSFAANHRQVTELLSAVTEALRQDEPYLVNRRILIEPIVFEEGADAMELWNAAEAQQAAMLPVLADRRLEDLVTILPAPRRVFWRDEAGNPVETVLTRFHEQLALASEIRMDDKGRPIRFDGVLWSGDDAAVDIFLKESPVKRDEETELPRVSLGGGGNDGLPPLDALSEARIDEILERLPGRSSVRLALLAVLAARSLVAAMQIAGLQQPPPDTDDGTRGEDMDPFTELLELGLKPLMIPRLPVARKGIHYPRTDVTRPFPGAVQNGFVPLASRQRNAPIRQPRPQNGGKIGKRSRF